MDNISEFLYWTLLKYVKLFLSVTQHLIFSFLLQINGSQHFSHFFVLQHHQCVLQTDLICLYNYRQITPDLHYDYFNFLFTPFFVSISTSLIMFCLLDVCRRNGYPKGKSIEETDKYYFFLIFVCWFLVTEFNKIDFHVKNYC